MSTTCTVTTSVDARHVIVEAVTPYGRTVQLIVERDEAMTLADDLTRKAEQIVPVIA